MTDDRAAQILLTRLETLAMAIRERDWDATEFEYGRVLSQARKIAGTRERHYDAAVRHVGPNPPVRGHEDRCHCGRPALYHISYGSGCGHVCGIHKRKITRAKNGHVTVHKLEVAS